MRLAYRVVVFLGEDGTCQARVSAFPSLHAAGSTPEEAIDAARVEIAGILDECVRTGRRPPPADREAVAIELISLPFEPKAHYRPNVQILITTGKVLRDGEEVAVRGSALALLVALACEPRDVSTERLSERLYAGIARDQAYDALKMCVYRTRKQLGVRGVIETSERGYRLGEDVVVDVRFLDQIVRAIRANSIAKAIETRLSAIFEQLIAGRPAAYATWDWFTAVERNLRNASREIGLYLAHRALRAGDPERALDIAQQLVELDPLDETVHELAIRVHLARRDRASALHVFRRYAQDLQAQHGMEPSPALRALIDPAP